MADTVSKHIDMTTGSLWRNVPLFAFPVAATSILEQLSNLIATVIIGNFSGDQGTLAMAAVGSNVPLTSLMLNLFIGMSLGSNVVIANAIGRNDQNMVKRAVHTSILMALVGFVVIALGAIFAEPMLAALNVPAETMPLASLYLRVFGISLTPALITMICVCGIRFYWVFCVFPHFRTFANIMMVYPISLGTTAFFMVVAVLLCHPARTYRATQAKATAR